MYILAPPLLLALSMVAVNAAANGQTVHRCIGADGNTVFADRRCEDLGVRERPGRAQAAASTSGRPAMAAGCAHSPQELAIRLRIAAESGDLNQMSAIYHWPGATRRSADSVLASLAHTLAQGVYAVELESSSPQMYAVAGPVTRASMDGLLPVAVRLEHAPGGMDGYPPASTRFGLARHMGCWWIRY